MKQRIHISDVDNNPAMCFDTGLDPRSFARTKMSQSLIEQGFIVNPDGSHEIWKPAGVNETNGSMRVFGAAFQGERLDILLDEPKTKKQTLMEAVIYWIRAKLILGDTRSSLNPGASFIKSNGSVFFTPEHLSNRCLYVEGSHLDRYNCPDLIGMDTAAFCAGVMLYKIITGNHPYPSKDIYQDMREGVFLPMRLAAPNMNEKLSNLIQAALLLPVPKKRTAKSGVDILTDLLNLLTNKENDITADTPLFIKLPKEKIEQIEREKKTYLFRQKVAVKTKRFVSLNKYFIIGCGLGLLFALFVFFSTARGFTQRPTTEGMSPDTVVVAYYEAFSSLNHILMQACINGADKGDINVAASLFAIMKQRQAYGIENAPSIIQARVWRQSGGELPSPNAFGVTDLVVDFVGGSEDEGLVMYRASYYLWSPDESFARDRSDKLMLKRDRRKHWRIIEIDRTER